MIQPRFHKRRTRAELTANFLLFLGIAVAARWLGSLALAEWGTSGWYTTFSNATSWAVGEGTFGLLWGLFDLLLAYTVWLVWRYVPDSWFWWPFSLYLGVIALELLWRFAFFNAHFLAGFLFAGLEVFVMTGSAVAFFRAHHGAGLLMAGLIAWPLYSLSLSSGVLYLIISLSKG